MGNCMSNENQIRPDETPDAFIVRRQYASYVATNDTERSMFRLHMNTYGSKAT